MLMWKILICFSDIARARIGAMKVAGRPHQTQQSPMVTSGKNLFFFSDCHYYLFERAERSGQLVRRGKRETDQSWNRRQFC